jgi:carbohydrate-selective porin OprB
MSGDADYEDIFEDAFFIAQADIKPQISGRQGNYRVYLWTNRTDHTELKNPLNDNESGTGWGISADQEVADHVTVFARIGGQDKKLYEVSTAWSGGLSLNGALWGRDDDTIGIAYGRAVLSGDNEDVLRAAGTNPGDEGHFEAYYSLAVNEHVTISPDIQVVTNAAGDSDFDTVWLGALRGQFNF